MMSETELVRRVSAAQARDEESFRVLVAAFYPMVYGLALSAIGNRTEAREK